jgi:hypothetical protein
VGVWFAAHEPLHASVHALLAVLFGLGAQRLALRKSLTADAAAVGTAPALEARLADLDKLPDVEGRLAELEERLDFAERALVDVRNRAQRPPRD